MIVRRPFVVGTAAILLAVGSFVSRAADAQSLSDVMTMSVCTNGISHAALPGVAPGDPRCTAMRKIVHGEHPTYYLRDFAPDYGAAGGVCANGFGHIVLTNVPVVIGGVPRDVSFSGSAANNVCASADTIGQNTGTLGVSVAWRDAASRYGFIMGSWSPVAVTFQDAYQYYNSSTPTVARPHTPVCQTSSPDSASRFYNGWIIGTSNTSPALPAPVGFATARIGIDSQSDYDALIAAGAACRAAYQAAFHIWRFDTFTFRSGLQLPALVSAHYTLANTQHTGPGNAQQLERTYWTKEFGFSRWEKWDRSDLQAATTPPPDQSARLLAHATCVTAGSPAGMPHEFVTNVADSHVAGPVSIDPATGISQTVVDASGTSHTWYMTLCEDYTNIDRSLVRWPLPQVPADYAALWNP